MNCIRKQLGSDVDERQRQQGNESEKWVERNEHPGHTQNKCDVRERERDHHDEHLHLVEVGRHAAHQLTSLSIVVILGVQTKNMVMNSLPEQRFDHATLFKRKKSPTCCQQTGR